jgi:hypothetical protein
MDENEKMQLLRIREIVQDYLDVSTDSTIAIRLTRENWQDVCNALEIAGEM